MNEVQTTTSIFTNNETVAYYNPKEPKIARDGKLFMDGGRVVTNVKGKEHQVIYATRHENLDIQTIYEEFKMTDDKVSWLKSNAQRLQKFNINVNALIEAWSPSEKD